MPKLSACHEPESLPAHEFWRAQSPRPPPAQPILGPAQVIRPIPFIRVYPCSSVVAVKCQLLEDEVLANILDVLQERGFVQQVSDGAGLRALGEREGVSVYCGYDPTASSLHMGHL